MTPTEDTVCSVHYQIETMHGTVVHSSYRTEEPLTLTPMQSPDRWSQEVLEMMNPGSKWEIYLPPEVVGADTLSRIGVGEDSVLMYTLELLGFPEVESHSKDDVESDSSAQNDGASRDEL